MTPRERCVRILLRMLAYPYMYTRKQLADHFNVSKDVVSECIDVYRNVGLHFDQDKPHYRCAIIPQKGFKELDRLLSLTPDDRSKIGMALQRYASTKDALYLQRKIESLYDFQQLGLRSLRRPELEKIDTLKESKGERKQVRLVNYRSNSNESKDRVIECFHIDTENGMIQAYDVKRQESRHFKLNRVERAELLEQEWQYNTKHMYKETDVFRIADNNRVMVHLILDTYAYNIIVDTFPQAIKAIIPGNTVNTYDFQDQVNHKFIGLTNFIMSNIDHVVIVSPLMLQSTIKEKAIHIVRKFELSN